MTNYDFIDVDEQEIYIIINANGNLIDNTNGYDYNYYALKDIYISSHNILRIYKTFNYYENIAKQYSGTAGLKLTPEYLMVQDELYGRFPHKKYEDMIGNEWTDAFANHFIQSCTVTIGGETVQTITKCKKCGYEHVYQLIDPGMTTGVIILLLKTHYNLLIK